MTTINKKIDFAIVFSVNNANPNGDPIDGNRPRTTFEGFGEVTDVCIKRKIRNRLLDEGFSILVQSDEKRSDEYRSLKDRADSVPELKAARKAKDYEKYAKLANERWIDTRAFGQVFAFAKGDGVDGTSIGVRGPVSIQSAYSVEPVNVSSVQITKSLNLETNKKDPNEKTSDTMGTKHRVDKGIYVSKGSINVQLAEKTGFSDEDAEAVKQALITLFRNDSSAARPDGSMEVLKVVWWKHNCKNGQYSSAKVHRSLKVFPDGHVTITEIPDLAVEIYDGE